MAKPVHQPELGEHRAVRPGRDGSAIAMAAGRRAGLGLRRTALGAGLCRGDDPVGVGGMSALARRAMMPRSTDASARNYRTEMERNLLYVACTRAMHRLSLISTGEPSGLLPASATP